MAVAGIQHKKQTVMLAPATGFYGSVDFGKDEVRLAYVLKSRIN
jgi:aspartate aminotransferase